MRNFIVIFCNGVTKAYDAFSAAQLRRHLSQYHTGFHIRVDC